MVGFGRNREITILFGLLLTVVDAKTPSSGTTWAGGSLTASAFVGPQKRLAQYGHFNERRSFTVYGDHADSPKTWCPSRRSVSLRAMPKVPEEEMEQRKKQLRDLLFASDEEIDKLVHDNPSLLKRRDVVLAYRPKLTLLQERLGMDQKAAAKLCLLTNANRMLASSLDTLESKMDWLQARLNLDKTQLRKIIERNTATLGYSIEDNLQPSLLSIQSCLALSDEELTKLIVKSPHLLNHNFSKKMAARLSFLQILLNIEEDDLATLRKAIFQRPDILFYPEERMVEVQHWISDRLGLSDPRIAQMCRNYPTVLTSKIKTLKGKVDWVQTALSLSDEELGKLFGKLPRLFGCCPKKNLEPKLRFLRLTFDVDDEKLKVLLLKAPSLFSQSEDIIGEKMQFYSELVGKSEAKRIVMESTNLLNISLKTRLRPRLAEVEKAGVKVEWSEQLIQRLARRSDDQWERYGLGEAAKGRPPSSNSS